MIWPARYAMTVLPNTKYNLYLYLYLYCICAALAACITSDACRQVALAAAADFDRADSVAAAAATVDRGTQMNAAETVEASTAMERRSTRSTSCMAVAPTRCMSAQTARDLYGVSTAAQTDASALAISDVSTTTEGLLSVRDASTCHYLVAGIGMEHAEAQTSTAMVTASDYEQLGIAMAASVEEAQRETEAKTKAKAAFDDLVTAIIRRKRIRMDGLQYNVYCEGEAEGQPEPRDGVYVLPWRPLCLG